MSTNLENLSNAELMCLWDLANIDYSESLYELRVSCNEEYTIRFKKLIEGIVAALRVNGFPILDVTSTMVVVGVRVLGIATKLRMILTKAVVKDRIAVRLTQNVTDNNGNPLFYTVTTVEDAIEIAVKFRDIQGYWIPNDTENGFKNEPMNVNLNAN